MPQQLGGRYEIGELLGRGGMAEVHLGRDTRLGRTVAVKMLRPDLARDPSFQARFRREAQSAASLNHPSIVAVYDTGEDEFAGNPVPVHRHGVRRGLDAARPADLRAAARARAGPRDRRRRARGAGLQPPARASCTATSSRPTSCSPRAARSRSWTSASPAPSPTCGATMTQTSAVHRHRAVPLAGAGPRRAGRRPQRPLLDRLPALRAAHRARRRSSATRRSRSPTSTCARSPVPPSQPRPRRVRQRRRDRAQGAGEGPRQPLPDRRRDARATSSAPWPGDRSLPSPPPVDSTQVMSGTTVLPGATSYAPTTARRPPGQQGRPGARLHPARSSP